MSTFTAKKKVSAYNWTQRHPIHNGESLDRYYSRYATSNMMQVTYADFMEMVWNAHLLTLRRDKAEVVWQ